MCVFGIVKVFCGSTTVNVGVHYFCLRMSGILLHFLRALKVIEVHVLAHSNKNTRAKAHTTTHREDGERAQCSTCNGCTKVFATSVFASFNKAADKREIERFLAKPAGNVMTALSL